MAILGNYIVNSLLEQNASHAPESVKRLVESVRVQTDAIKEAIDKHADSRSKERASDRESIKDVIGPFGSITDAIESYSKKREADGKDSYEQQERLINLQKNIVLWTACAVFAACAYGLVAAWQGSLMRRTYGEVRAQTQASTSTARAACESANTAAKQLASSTAGYRMDERAWVKIGNSTETASGASNLDYPSFIFGLHPKNIGKTIAINIHVWANTEEGESNVIVKKSLIQRILATRRYVEPQTGKVISAFPYSHGPHTLAPGESYVAPVLLISGGTHAVNKVLNMSIILGKITYSDAFGVDHWSTFCYEVWSGGALMNCEYGNEEDQNAEPVERQRPQIALLLVSPLKRKASLVFDTSPRPWRV